MKPRLTVLLIIGIIHFVLSLAAAAAQTAVNPNVLSLPKGPGAIEGLGKSFQPYLNTGTFSYTVPLTLPPAPGGFAPTVEITYNSGAGNSPLGPGWKLAPMLVIERQTEKGFPRYRNSDTFVFNGEELVPLSDGSCRTKNENGFRRFTPFFSQEGGPFDRWLIEDPNGVKHWLGSRPESRVSNPQPPDDSQPLGARGAFDRTYTWYEDAAEDPSGNRIEFDYQTFPESKEVLYLERLRYYARGQTDTAQVVQFYYEPRDDALIDNRAGFAQTLGRRCREVAVYSQRGSRIERLRSYVLSYQPADGALGDVDAGAPAAQRRIELGVTRLYAITQYDRHRNPDNISAEPGTALPPLRFAYSGLYLQNPADTVRRTLKPLDFRWQPDDKPDPLQAGAVVTSVELPFLPLADPAVTFVDLNGDGLPDLLDTHDSPQHNPQVAMNLGKGLFGPLEPCHQSSHCIIPSLPLTPDEPGAPRFLADLTGDGLADFVEASPSPYPEIRIYPNRHDPGKPDSSLGFDQTPLQGGLNVPSELRLSGPHVRLLDLNFDKRTDVLVSDDNGIQGYVVTPQGDWQKVGRQQWDAHFRQEDYDFAQDGASNPFVHLADMNGDRLLDLVRLIHQGQNPLEICYRPMSGSVHWGEQSCLGDLTLDGLSGWDVSDVRDLEALHLIDVNGDGLTDLVQIRRNYTVAVWFNQAGRALRGPYEIRDTPAYQPDDENNRTVVRTLDLLGHGGAGLLFYQPASGAADYLDLMPGQKPGLLQVIDNGIGKRTFIRYRPSTEDLLRAQRKGQPWTTTLPFPVWVVSGIVEDIGLDLNGDGQPDRYATSFDYRDGYYDGAEHQFRGFAYAQQIVWGDDVDPATGLPRGTGLTGSGAPTAITRYRFMTGAPDGVDNDERIPTCDDAPTVVDEYCNLSTPTAQCMVAGRSVGIDGREEEPLKGKPVWQEEVDGGALGVTEADFDTCARQTALAAQGNAFGPTASRCTPDALVYSRVSSEWMIRPLYRPENTTAPRGRLRDASPVTGEGKLAGSVRWALLTRTTTEHPEANGWLRQHFSDAKASVQSTPDQVVETRQEYGYDDYGNRTLERDLGIFDDRNPMTGDERITRRAFIIDTKGGNNPQERRWFLNRPQSERVEDAEGRFARETRYFYDGPAFEGLPLGQLGERGLLSRTQQRVFDPASPTPPLTTTPATAEGQAALRVPGDPVNPSPEWLDTERKQYDVYGNVIGLMDPLGKILPNGEADTAAGHMRQVRYDSIFHALPVEERIHLGAGQPKLTVRVDYERPAGSDTAAVPMGFGVITRSWDFNGHPTDYDYDGHPTDYDYDSFARLTAVVRPGDSAALPTTRYTYRMADPHRRLLYDYDRSGRLLPEDQPRPAAANEIASSVRTDRRERSGEPGEQTQIAYVDGAGHALLRMEEDSTPGRFVVREATRYGLRGTPIQRFQPYPVEGDGFALPLADTVAHSDLSYDATGRVIRTLAPPETAEANAPRSETRTHYLPFSEWVFSEEALASADPAQSHLGTPSIRHYDGLGRLVGVDEVVWNRGDGRAKESETWQTRYGYDLNDHLVHIEDSQHNHKWFRFDGLGRKVFMNDPDRGEMRYRYDAAGNLVETRDAAGQRITYAYDGANRLAAETYIPAGAPDPATPAVVYHYDQPAGPLASGPGQTETARNTLGQLAWVADLSGEEHHSYDDRGRLQWQVKRIRAPGGQALADYRFDNTYDALDRATALQYPDGARLDYRYNPRGLLDSLFLGETALVQGTDYLPSGQKAAIRYGNGVSTAFAYDPRLRLRALDTRDRDNQPLIAYRYQYDFGSNLLGITDARPPSASWPNNSQSFSYDDLDRLIRVGYGQGGIDYRYDPIGNLIRQDSDIPHQERGQHITQLGALCYGGQALSPSGGACQGLAGSGAAHRIGKGDPPGPHALTSTRNGPVRYDAQGNTTELEGQRLSWDVKNRLVDLETDQAKATYTYDYTDRRVLKQVQSKSAAGQTPPPPATTVYVDRHYELREGQPVHYAYQGDSRVAQWTADLADLVRYHPDHLGSADVLTDTDGRVTEEYAYYPYGHPRAHRAPRADGPRAAHYQFTQKERDAESGLQYFEARYYAGHLGRFISVDPLLSENPRPRANKDNPFGDLLNTQNINQYHYAGGNPVRMVDPTGLAFSDFKEGAKEGFLQGAAIGIGVGITIALVPVTGPVFIVGGVILTGLSLIEGYQLYQDPTTTSAEKDFYLGQMAGNAVGGSIGVFTWYKTRINLNARPTSSSIEAGVIRWELPSIKAGAAGGETAGKAFPQAIKGAANAENPLKVCVYCQRAGVATQVDHAIPKARGGNATLDNAQLACPHCNASKGARDFPVNPPPDYFGKWPPSHWGN